ncbi:MAG: hypothetical protein D6710_10175, partial [Nitrospirae bacterium]
MQVEDWSFLTFLIFINNTSLSQGIYLLHAGLVQPMVKTIIAQIKAESKYFLFITLPPLQYFTNTPIHQYTNIPIYQYT